MNSNNIKICRTCLSRVHLKECICISTEEDNVASILEMLSFTIPEMNLYLVSHPVICKQCLKLLNICFKFKTECIKSEEHLLKYSHNNNNTEVRIEDIPLPKFRKQLVEDSYLEVDGEFPDLQKLSRSNLSCKKCHGCDTSSLDPSMHKKVLPSSSTVCYVCDRRLNTLSEMRKHVLSHIKLRKCKICKKNFRDLSQLKIHLRVHTQAKPYKCNLCEKAFQQKHSLTQHMYQHTGSASVKCKHCNKAFSTKYNAQVHMKTCQKLLQKCDLCGETFLSKKDLVKHLETSTDTCRGDYIKIEVKEENYDVYMEENLGFINAENIQRVDDNDVTCNIKQESS